MKSTFYFWLDVLAVSAGNTLDFVRKKAAIGIAIAVLSLALQLVLAVRTWPDVWRGLVITLSALGLITLVIMMFQVLTVPVQQRAALEKQHSADLAARDALIKQKDTAIGQKEAELSELRSRMFQTPIRFRPEKDKTRTGHVIVVDVPEFGGTSRRHHILVAPAMVLVVWKTPQSRDFDVTLTTCRFQTLQRAILQPDFSVRQLVKDNEQAIDVTEKLVSSVAGDPFNLDRLFLFEQDIQAVLGYEVNSNFGEVTISFRLKGKLSAGTLRVEIENLANPLSSTGGQ